MTFQIPLSVAASEDAAGALVAERVLDRLAEGGALRLGCPAGRTPTTTYAALGRLAATRGVDLSELTIVMMDEYVIAGPDGFVACDATAPFSCHRYASDHLLPLLNRGLPAEHRISPDSLRWPDPAEPAAFEAEIDAIGGIDVFLLASGATDGHVAFNPPGTAPDSRTRIVELADSTRMDNLRTFPFNGLEEVPSFGVTVGLGTIADARETVLVLLGAGKATAFDRLQQCDGFDPTWPASVIHRCNQPWIVADEAAVASYDAARGS